MKTAQAPVLIYNSRFYVLFFSMLLSLGLFAWLRVEIESDQLLAIRAQQMYGFVCLLFWYVALIISPLGAVIGKKRIRHLEFARRAIGVSAFYFALLHALVALFGQLGGIDQLQYLPNLFKWSLAGGFVALIVLGLMAATSFDKVVTLMTYRKWKWLHRLVYGAGILVILHVWTIGTHLAYTHMQVAGYLALVLLIGLELHRAVARMNEKRFHLKQSDVLIISITLWTIIAVLLLALPSFVANYHSRHANHYTHQVAE